MSPFFCPSPQLKLRGDVISFHLLPLVSPSNRACMRTKRTTKVTQVKLHGADFITVLI